MITPELQRSMSTSRAIRVNVQNLVRVAHHVDAKKVCSGHDLSTFVARFLSYQPFWVSALYRLRPVLLRALGAQAERIPEHGYIRPEDVRYETGQRVWFFSVRGGEADRSIVLRASNSLLIAHLVIERGPSSDERDAEAEFRVTTIVRYRNMAGRCYFNMVRPFHHMVVRSAMNAAAKPIEDAALEMQKRRPRIGFVSVSGAMRQRTAPKR